MYVVHIARYHRLHTAIRSQLFFLCPVLYGIAHMLTSQCQTSLAPGIVCQNNEETMLTHAITLQMNDVVNTSYAKLPMIRACGQLFGTPLAILCGVPRIST